MGKKVAKFMHNEENAKTLIKGQIRELDRYLTNLSVITK